MQMGVVSLHVVELVLEHSTQSPLEQAGVLADGQGSVEVDPLSPLHASQMPVRPSQTGALAGHSALFEHPHVPVDVLHTGVVGPHALLFVAEHCAQLPSERQAGADASGHACVAAVP
jgi:hypothetical protein